MKYFKTNLYIVWGLIFIAISSLLFLINPNTFDDSSGLFTFTFMIHYSVAIIYIFILKNSCNRFFSLFGKDIYSGHLLLLILFNISAYSLNREVIVFYESVQWLSILIVIENVILILIGTLKVCPKWLKTIYKFTLPIFLVFHIHQVLLTLSMYAFGFIGGLFIGIGLLLFVPIFYLIAHFRTFLNLTNLKKDWALFIPGFVLLFSIISFSVYQWNSIDSSIRDEFMSADDPFNDQELPLWVAASKNLEENYFLEKYLKSELVYQKYEDFPFFGSGFNTNFDESNLHDPLISLCMGLGREPSMDLESRIKVLKFLFDKRHETVDRFWSGDNLTTDQVVTNIELFPEERLSYSELILTIANNDRPNRWRPQEEAIYTFQLPEGGVITSLSLWVNGKEEKGILTTKTKAQRAYNTIVGREMRDPTVIYWMEGNKARIRVFPCTPNAKRKLKVGVTAPLKIQNSRMHYQPVTFDGPSAFKAFAAVNIVTPDEDFESSLSFSKQQSFFSWKGDYQKELSLTLGKEEIRSNIFRFNNESFQVQEAKEELSPFDPQTVYLDVSNKWTQEELNRVQSTFEGKKIIAFDGQKADIPPASYSNFTLFPYHRIDDGKTSLVITKGDHKSPNLEDLKGSTFRENLFSYFNKTKYPVLVLDIGNEPNAFNRSLKEFNVINYFNVSLDDLKRFNDLNSYPVRITDENTIRLEGNGLSISKTTQTTNETGSDHLMRLFYYQMIMDRIGKEYFNADDKSYIQNELTQLASTANVVTPVSSLIVLETQEDYDRFGIERNIDSLGNATIKDNGAAPEPHEWALIIGGFCFLIFFYAKSRFHF